MTQTLKLWSSILSQQGVGRTNNEDSIFFRNFTDERYAIYGVADGIGGLDDGEKASYEISRIFESFISSSPNKTLRERVEASNKLIHGKVKRQGSTISSIVIDKKNYKYHCISVGDSRTYLYRNNHLRQISKDDVPDSSTYAPNLITKAIGLQGFLGDVSIHSGEVLDGDIWLISTDGLHSYVESELIAEIIQMFKKQSILSELLKAAFNRGSNDDISAILCLIN